MADEKRKNSVNGRVNPDIFPCPICGGEDYEWGYTTGHTSAGLRFRSADDEKFSTGRWIKVRECVRCGNLQWFTRD